MELRRGNLCFVLLCFCFGFVGSMQMLLQNFSFAFRSLLNAPGFSFVVIISIALAFAANATVFSVANGLLWGVLPVKDGQSVVMFSEGRSFSYPDYVDFSDQSR